MGFNADLTVILREIVQFLECLREVKLSGALETVRESLLTRSKNTLSVVATTEVTTEHYLSMNSSSKGLLALQTNELDGQEYVRCEETAKTEDQQNHATSQIHSDYYETFLSVTAEDEKKKEQEKLQEIELLEIYYSLSATQAKSKSIKCGPLYRKEGKKLFVFEQFRTSWVALIGSHLLMYGSERDSKPHLVQDIRGYSGRPAPNAVARDQRRSEAAFEIFKPGSKTLQFIARTSKDMEQWVAKICQINSYRTSNFDHKHNSKEELSSEKIVEMEEIIPKDRSPEPKLKSTFATVNEIKTIEPDQKMKVVTAEKKDYLSVSTHIPTTLSRQLPSLPTDQVISSYENMHDEEDNIYHRIGEFENNTCHQNPMVKNQLEKSKDSIYDDCPATLKKEHINVSMVSKEVDPSSKIQNERRDSNGIYDDIGNATTTLHEKSQVIRSGNVNDTCESQSSVTTTMPSNDDTEASVSSSPGNKIKDKDEIQKKLPNKKSFLDRMRNRKESPQKKEKIIATRRETTPINVQTNEMPIYDDVFNLIVGKGAPFVPEEICEYTCPPTPRPVYTKPPEEEAIYDDIKGCHQKKVQQLILPKQMNAHSLENKISDDDEHYKAPRSTDIRQQAVSSQPEDQLYDDIAILVNFTARQKRISDEIKDQDTSKSPNSPDKKSWNKFVTNRKSKANDSSSSGLNKRASTTEIADPEGFEEQPNLNRKNTFQKLINKMENSLGKVSPRTTPVTSTNKTYGLNTSS